MSTKTDPTREDFKTWGSLGGSLAKHTKASRAAAGRARVEKRWRATPFIGKDGREYLRVPSALLAQVRPGLEVGAKALYVPLDKLLEVGERGLE